MKTGRRLVALGLLIAIAGSSFVTPYFSMPDFLKGFLMSIGISLEIIGIVMMKRKGSSCNKKQEPIA